MVRMRGVCAHLLVHIHFTLDHKLARDGLCRAAGELANRPRDRLGRVVVLPSLLLRAGREVDRGARRRFGHREGHPHVGPVVLVGKLGTDLQPQLLLVLGDRREHRRHAEGDLPLVAQRANVEVHQHKLAVRRLEHEHALRLELAEVDALVEIHIVELNHAVARVAAARNHELVVERQVQLRGSREVRLHLDRAVDRKGAHLFTRSRQQGG